METKFRKEWKLLNYFKFIITKIHLTNGILTDTSSNVVVKRLKQHLLPHLRLPFDTLSLPRKKCYTLEAGLEAIIGSLGTGLDAKSQ